MYQDPNSIVTVQVSTILAPYPSSFQQSGALVSYGGTNLLAGSTAVLTQFIDLTSVIKLAGKITTATWATGIVTCETENPLDGIIGSVIPLTLTG